MEPGSPPPSARTSKGDPRTERKAKRPASDEWSIVVEFRHFADGSAALVTPYAAKTIEAMTGKPVVRQQIQVLDDNECDEDPLNVFNLKKLRIREVGNVENTMWVPCVHFKTAAAMGYSTAKELIDSVVAPVWSSYGVEVEHVGRPIVNVVELTTKWVADTETFSVRGTTDPMATKAVHPHIINWKDYHLIIAAPIWRNKSRPYDPKPVMDKLRSLSACITLTETGDPVQSL